MEKEIILENLDESIVNEATFYSQQNVPSRRRYRGAPGLIWHD